MTRRPSLTVQLLHFALNVVVLFAGLAVLLALAAVLQ